MRRVCADFELTDLGHLGSHSSPGPRDESERIAPTTDGLPSTSIERSNGYRFASAPCSTCTTRKGMTHSEIAEALELPLGTIKSDLVRGHEKLKEWLTGGTQ